MTTDPTLIAAHALGSATMAAIIWLPITYFAMRKQFQLRTDLRRAWLPFLSCVAILTILELLGLKFSTDTVYDLMVFLAVPICICAVVLYFTYRTPKPAP